MTRYAALVLLFPLLAWTGCQTSTAPSAETAKLLEQEHPIDGMNRNVGETQGGSVHDPYTLNPPPIRRDYANDR